MASVLHQPIIENAVMHGIKNMSQDGELWILVRSESDKVIINVEGQGVRAWIEIPAILDENELK